MTRPSSTDARLWAITAYFNPCGYHRRAANYHVFRERLRVPLVTVELAFGDAPFALGASDADILIQVRGRDVMWQKERLLNLGLEALPAACAYVAWLDCDVVFADDDWAAGAMAALERTPVIQPFETAHEFGPDADPAVLDVEQAYLSVHSLAHALATGRATADVIGRPDSRLKGIANGLAWAARRELIDEHHLYDACIVGGGDGAIAGGVHGNFGDIEAFLLFNPQRRAHYRRWAEPFYGAVQGRLGVSAGAVFHLWHGAIADRRYGERRAQFATYDFDPFEDIALAEGGAWQWHSHKPAMHRFVRDYFVSRCEDGPAAAGPRPAP